MRRILYLAVWLAFLMGPLLAQEPAVQAQEASPQAQEPASAAPRHARQTWEQRFSQANLAHDGHLTLEEAQSGYSLVAKHFDDIDIDHKGYVTTNDVRAWRIMRKAGRRLPHPPENKVRAQRAFQLRYPDQRPPPKWVVTRANLETV
jgi:hypothetical protein